MGRGDGEILVIMGIFVGVCSFARVKSGQLEATVDFLLLLLDMAHVMLWCARK